MRKPQSQPTLATLSAADKELLADWLRTEKYNAVLDRVRKPRSEGGFGLTTSKKPLQTFYAKVALLDLINSRVSDDKKLTITQFESLAAGDLLLSPGQNEKCQTLNDQSSMKETAPASPAPSSFSSVQNPQPAFRNPQSSEVHTAILNTTHDLATSGDNTPTQLLALQRLADFPARAEYREHVVSVGRGSCRAFHPGT